MPVKIAQKKVKIHLKKNHRDWLNVINLIKQISLQQFTQIKSTAALCLTQYKIGPVDDIKDRSGGTDNLAY